jgi:8-oxo-dGTP pyrophosphatase MutT (NUDIX family)
MTYIRSEEEEKRLLESFSKRVSSAALILETEQGQVIVEKAKYKPYWTFPGGIIDAGETPKQAAVRETFEEIGLKIDPSEVSFVAIATRSSKIAETYQFIFHATVNSDITDNIVLQGSEIEAWDVATKKQVLAFDKVYSQAVIRWAKGKTGYIEQSFGKVD